MQQSLLLLLLLLLLQQHARVQCQSVSASVNTVEIALFIDYSSWQFFVNQYGSVRAEVEIKHYYGYMVDGMQQIFGKINNQDFSIVPIVTQLVIYKMGQPSWMIERNGFVQRYETLIKLDDYLQNERIGIRFDHVMAITRTPLNGNSNGIANFAATCSEMSLSLVLDTGLGTWQTAAHELVHSLAGRHNSETECGDKNGFLMNSAGQGIVDIAVNVHSCTVDEMKTFVNGLNHVHSNCMKIQNGQNVLQNFRKTYSLNEACHFNKAGSTYTGPAVATPSSCSILDCQQQDGTIFSSTAARAAVGTECGNGGVCNWAGRCEGDTNGGGEGGASCLDVDGREFCSEMLAFAKSSPDLKDIYCSDAELRKNCCESFSTFC